MNGWLVSKANESPGFLQHISNQLSKIFQISVLLAVPFVQHWPPVDDILTSWPTAPDHIDQLLETEFRLAFAAIRNIVKVEIVRCVVGDCPTVIS